MSSSRSTTRSDSASSMARTHSDVSDQDQLRFSVDLVSAARKNIQLMRAVFESQWLRSRSALLEAIRRYEELWMPLISELTVAESPAPMVLPPFDIEWVWFCHTLDPVGYRSYCESKFSKLIGKAVIIDDENEEYAIMRCREIWIKKYPTEPLENQFDSIEYSNDQISLNPDLVCAILQHTELYSRFAEPYRCELVYLIAAKQRYKRLLHLLDGEAEGCATIVPSSDISLMLLSHQSYPTAYARDVKEFESGLGKMLEIWTLPKPEDVKESKKLWERAYDQPYEKAGGEIHVGPENCKLTKLPVYWDVSDADVNMKYKSLSPRFLLEVIVQVRLAYDTKISMPDVSRDYLCLRMIRSHKELKIDKPVSTFLSDSWEKIWHLYPEFGTRGITLELRRLSTGLFKGNAVQETAGVHWNDLLRSSSLTIEKELDHRVRVAISVTPPVQAPYFLKCVPDKVTDDLGDMVCDEILKMNNYKPQEGRWLSRTVLDHAGRECFVCRIRVASGFWRRGAEAPSTVKWEDRITEILQGSWSYVAGPIGRAPGKLVGTAAPKQLLEEQKVAWSLSTGSELLVSWDSSSVSSLRFHLSDQTDDDSSCVKLLKGRNMQYNIKNLNQVTKYIDEKNEENDKDGEEEGFVTLVRFTEEYPKGKATALLNWKLLAVEVLPEEDVVFVLLICISILRSVSWIRKVDIGGLLIRRRLKEAKLGVRDWGSVVVHPSVPISSPHVQPWYCNVKEVIASDRDGSVARLPVVSHLAAEGAESLYKRAIFG